MEKTDEQLSTLHDIRRMMRESSRFLSLSGLSGVLAGVYALAGAWLAQRWIGAFSREVASGSMADYAALVDRLLLDAFAVLLLSILTAVVLSQRKARRRYQKLFDRTSGRVFWSMAIPLLAGALFCTALLRLGDGFVLMIAPAMLLFYGMALLNCSKHTLPELGYLGGLQMALGTAAAFAPQSGLLFWALGFGVLHLIYGAIVWYRYDR